MQEIYNKEKAELEEYSQNYQSGFAGWQIEHTYRTTNKFGAVVLFEKTFIIDKDF